jgi:hypothetical protein
VRSRGVVHGQCDHPIKEEGVKNREEIRGDKHGIKFGQNGWPPDSIESVFDIE